LAGCGKKAQPKPYGYFRIDIPDHEYVMTSDLGPYSIEKSAHCHPDKSDNTHATDADEWINLVYPSINAKIHLSYKRIDKSTFQQVAEECHSLAYKHTVRADAIQESYYGNDTTRVYGILYEMKGNAASPAQFYVTDSVRNFLRGSLYFNHTPNADSIAPAANYVLQDMIHMIETLEWNEE
jgi:gliding motility-associated lipoprotein GldD